MLSPSCFFVRPKLLFLFDSSYFILFLIFFFFNTEIKHTEDGSGEVFKHYTQRCEVGLRRGVFTNYILRPRGGRGLGEILHVIWECQQFYVA